MFLIQNISIVKSLKFSKQINLDALTELKDHPEFKCNKE